LADSTLPAKANRPAWIPSALDGISHSVDLINEKRIKVIINGGGLDPKGLALEVDKLVGLPLQCLVSIMLTDAQDPI
jgi:hypothetical protein